MVSSFVVVYLALCCDSGPPPWSAAFRLHAPFLSLYQINCCAVGSDTRSTTEPRRGTEFTHARTPRWTHTNTHRHTRCVDIQHTCGITYKGNDSLSGNKVRSLRNTLLTTLKNTHTQKAFHFKPIFHFHLLFFYQL